MSEQLSYWQSSNKAVLTVVLSDVSRQNTLIHSILYITHALILLLPNNLSSVAKLLVPQWFYWIICHVAI